MSFRFSHLLLSLLVSGAVSVTQAQTTVDLPVSADTAIFSAYPDDNFGASTLQVGANALGQPGRSLLLFDLSTLPAGAIITSASISMTVVRMPPIDGMAQPLGSDFELYKMYVPWEAGNGTGNSGFPGQPGETTWNLRVVGDNGIGDAPWNTPGGAIGEDFASAASASASIGTTLGLDVWGSTPQFVADVQSWLDDPSQNFGYMVISSAETTGGTGRRIASLENAGGVNPPPAPPSLTVTYTTAPEPASATFIAAGLAIFAGRRTRRTQLAR